MPEEVTPNRGYQLPAEANALEDDVYRLRAALTAIDADVDARPTDAELAAALALKADAAATSSALAGKADKIRQILAGDGLAGGGSLNADVTLSLSPSNIAALALAGTAVQPARTIFTSNGLTGGGSLAANRTISPVYASQVEAEAGTAATVILSPLRGAQLVAALRPWASQAQAETGTDAATAMSPLRTAQAIALQTPGVPVVTVSGARTIVSTDRGKIVSNNTGGWTIPTGLPQGFAVSMFNANDVGATQVITQGSGVSLRLAGTSLTGNRSLGVVGLATAVHIGSEVWVITGAGLT